MSHFIVIIVTNFSLIWLVFLCSNDFWIFFSVCFRRKELYGGERGNQLMILTFVVFFTISYCRYLFFLTKLNVFLFRKGSKIVDFYSSSSVTFLAATLWTYSTSAAIKCWCQAAWQHSVDFPSHSSIDGDVMWDTYCIFFGILHSIFQFKIFVISKKVGSCQIAGHF